MLSALLKNEKQAKRLAQLCLLCSGLEFQRRLKPEGSSKGHLVQPPTQCTCQSKAPAGAFSALQQRCVCSQTVFSGGSRRKTRAGDGQVGNKVFKLLHFEPG